MQFIDQLKLQLKLGKGGDGIVAFRQCQLVGQLVAMEVRGGSVILVAVDLDS